ncbi:Hypothetical protein SRAE_2000067600 [Strongyloides ratti]|uniref:MARVEL domain-containing protein n=1 Tax=Strongyloides ratti TaxID=34506 RepID=A0A090LCZ7_STRRB|nr:Hypothetical protein SRAE_2000067600 [Strongyloides ratti]CEF66003.1 Hypothetical protein SRAE_2000067600 [Strongyloides ratti]
MVKLQVNWKFLIARPYGILLTGRMILLAILVISILILKYRINDGEWLNLMNALFLIWSIVSVLAHLFNFQKNLSKLPNTYFYIPFAYLDFVIGIIGIVFFTFESVTIFTGIIFHRYYFYYLGDFVLFLLALTSSFVVGCCFGYYSLLLHVQTQNIKDLPISQMVVEGDKITYFVAANESSEKSLPTI